MAFFFFARDDLLAYAMWASGLRAVRGPARVAYPACARYAGHTVSVPRAGCARTFSSCAPRASDVDPPRGPYLPEDPTPAMWQRVMQLIAGTVATGTCVYFVLFADFGEGEHCFKPVRGRALTPDSSGPECGYGHA